MNESQDRTQTELPNSESKPRRWTHYAFEFLMLFLAVTLGFFVENQRERLSEREEEKRLVITLLNDVKTDIQRVDEIIQLRLERIEKNDSLYQLLSSPDRNDHMADIYKLMSNARSLRTLFYMSNTMIFLANGGFQRFNNPAVEDETRKYYLLVQDVLAAQQSSLAIGQELTEKSRVLMDVEVMFILRNPKRESKKVMNLFSVEPEIINQYSNALLHFSANCGVQIQHLNKIREQGEKLIISIKEEYNL